MHYSFDVIIIINSGYRLSYKWIDKVFSIPSNYWDWK